MSEKQIIKILVILKNIDSGTGTFVLTLLKLSIYNPNIFNIKVLVLEKPSYRKIVNKNIKILRPPSFYPQKHSFSPSNFYFFIQELLEIKSIVSQFNPNIIMGVDLRCNLLATLSKYFSKNRIKVVTTTHIDLKTLTLDRSNKAIKILFKVIISLFYDLADTNVTVSKKLATNLKKMFNITKKVTTIYNGLDLKPGIARKLRRENNYNIISVASMSAQKDHDTLLKAFVLVNRAFPKSKLLLVGDGPKKSNLKKITKKIKLTKKVMFLGWSKKVNYLLKKSDLFVLSSKSEGFGFVLVEAMSQGLPIISTNTPHGPDEILDNGKYGILTPIGNEKLMAENIINTLNNSKKYSYYSKQSLKRSKYFTEAKMLNNYKNLFLKLVK